MSRPIALCSIEGCGHRAHGQGLCETHYRRMRRGRPVEGPLKATVPSLDRFMAFVSQPDGPDGCWVWQGTTTGDGYGFFRVGSRTDGSRTMVLAHRWAYEHWVGPIPEGKELDHVVCDNPPCCNPRHVEPATHEANSLRSRAPTAVNARKTHCPKGHEYTDANTYRWPGAKGSSRQCRECQRSA